jgi:hypothetical protein
MLSKLPCHVRSGNRADPVRYYTVEPGKQLTGAWNAVSSYDLSVYGPNGFVRFFKGSTGLNAAVRCLFDLWYARSRFNRMANPEFGHHSGRG